jgi:hypothetical protein
MQIQGADTDVFSGGSDNKNAKLAPAAESPDTKAWRSAATTPPPVVDAPAPVAAPPVAAPPAAARLAAVSSPVVLRPAVAAAPAKAPASAPASPRPAVAAVTPPAASAGHGASVQLAALTTEQAAHGEWQELTKRMPDLLGSRQPSYSRTEHDGHTYWRVRTAGFADVGQARGFCEKVKAKGGGCSVTEF